MRHLFIPACLFVSALSMPVIVWAQSAPLGGSMGGGKAPVEITADDAIEWLRNDHMYRARGAAIAKQGDTTIKADTLEAVYDPALGEQSIHTITANGRVDIVSKDHSVVADRGVYDVNTGIVTLTGQNLRLSGPDMNVTATESLSYDRNGGKASARGNAVIIAQGKTLKAQIVDAWFDKQNNLTRATAQGRVIIKTEQGEILESDNADYNVTTQQAVMTGNVKITREQNHLQGARATVNLKTGVSQLFGSANSDTAATGNGSGGRVRAIFFPGSNKNVMPQGTTDTLIPMKPRRKTGQTP